MSLSILLTTKYVLRQFHISLMQSLSNKKWKVTWSVINPKVTSDQARNASFQFSFHMLVNQRKNNYDPQLNQGLLWTLFHTPLKLVFNYYYDSFKIFPLFWLAKSTRLIHHNQLLMTKFGRILTLTRKWRQKCSVFAR